jgi:hypothetical protein
MIAEMIAHELHQGTAYLRIDPQMIDFATAALVHKVTDDYAVRVRAPSEHISTIIHGHLETERDAHKGDWRVYNIGNVDAATIPGYDAMSPEAQILARAARAECYVLNDEAFKAAHTNLRAQGSGVMASPTPVARPAMTLPFNAVFKASWGEDEYVKAGGFMVKNGDRIYGIEQGAMQRTYAPWGETATFIETHAAQIRARKPLVPEVVFAPNVAQAYALAAASLIQKQ